MEHQKKHQSKSFASRWGFILASVGSAVGMANVWGFPSKMGANGGGAFLLTYSAFHSDIRLCRSACRGICGRRRRAGTGTLGAYENAWATARQVPWASWAGLWRGCRWRVRMCIAIGYAVIISYVLKALVDSVMGTLLSIDTAEWFASFSQHSFSVVPYHVIVVVGTLLTLFLGAHSIERTNKIMMPLFFIIFVILAVRVAMLPGAAAGYQFMFTPRWEKLADPQVWIWAMGQAFFSLSITGSGMIVYGASCLKTRTWCLCPTRHCSIQLRRSLASLVMIPACFS